MMGTPPNSVSGFFLVTTPIRYSGGNGHATGFFLNHYGTTYLVTNKHVLDISTHNGNPLEEVRIFIRPNPANVLETEHHDLRIHLNDQPTWLSHDNFEIDIAALPLEPPITDEPIEVPSYDPLIDDRASANQSPKMGNLALTLADTPTSEQLVNETSITAIRGGSQAMILGYPLETSNNYLPVARSALISSPYGENVNEFPFFRTDARTHPGLSGSPVITTTADSTAKVRIQDGSVDVSTAAQLLQDIEWYFIGIHAQSSDEENVLGLNDAFYPYFLGDFLPSTK